MLRLIIAICLLGVIGSPAAALGRIDTIPAFSSAYVMPRQVTVWTPEGYDPKGPPLPVLYMHDGENLYEPSHSLSHADWGIAATVSRLIKAGKIPPVIIVGMNSTPLRGREYLPAGIVAKLPEATRTVIEASWKGPSLADAYLAFIILEVKPYVDRHYRTKTDAAHTFIMGSSMGGLISFYAQAEHPEVFGGSASLSLHMLMGGPVDMVSVDQKGLEKDVIAAFDRYVTDKPLTSEGHKIYVDRGDQTLDAYYGAYTADFDAMMSRHGWNSSDTYMSRTYPGAAHSEPDWARRLDIPLEFLLGGK